MPSKRVSTVEEKTPSWVHCGPCEHEWIAAYLPLPVDVVAKLWKAPCPMCGGKKTFLGKIPRETPTGDVEAWIGNGDTGTSSMTIWAVLLGRTSPNGCFDIPWDPSDFGRCYRLLQIAPEWRTRLGEVATRVPAWKPFVAAWDELTALFEEEAPSGTCPKLWARMRELRV